jgi:hypothetical protein
LKKLKVIINAARLEDSNVRSSIEKTVPNGDLNRFMHKVIVCSLLVNDIRYSLVCNIAG